MKIVVYYIIIIFILLYRSFLLLKYFFCNINNIYDILILFLNMKQKKKLINRRCNGDVFFKISKFITFIFELHKYEVICSFIKKDICKQIKKLLDTGYTTTRKIHFTKARSR